MARQSTGKRPVFSASAVLEIVGDALETIKREDDLSDADIGAILGKSEDMAAKYRKGWTDMGLVSFARGMREWNGRFYGTLRRLCEETRPGASNDRVHANDALRGAFLLNEALDGENQIPIEDVRKNRASLEKARDALDAQLHRLGPVVESVR